MTRTPADATVLRFLVAPFAVGFLAYSNLVGGIDRFAALLFYFGLFMFAVVAPKVFRLSVGYLTVRTVGIALNGKLFT